VRQISKYCIITTVSFFFILGCEGPAGPAGVQGTAGKDGGFDKQLRFDFSITDTLQTADTAGAIMPYPFRIIKFNKSNYLNVDSIVLVAFLRSTDTSAICQLKLVNVTDNVDIDTSLIQSDTTIFTLFASKNIFNSLPPNKEITLAVKIKTTKKDTLVQALSPAVYLYRR